MTAKTNSTVKLSAVVASVAATKGIEPTKAGKLLRAHIRRNFDSLKEQGWDLGNKENRDGNRYPEMPREVADNLITRFTPQDDTK